MSGYAGIGLVGVQRAANLGGVLRAARVFDARLVLWSGRLRTPAGRGAGTNTVKAHRHMPAIHVPDVMAAIPHGAVPVLVEKWSDATPLPVFRHPRTALYVFGPENGSLPRPDGDMPRVVIPSAWCLNLAAAVNVVLYDRTTKRGQPAPAVVEINPLTLEDE